VKSVAESALSTARPSVRHTLLSAHNGLIAIGFVAVHPTPTHPDRDVPRVLNVACLQRGTDRRHALLNALRQEMFSPDNKQ
jgi:hypothetical protein